MRKITRVAVLLCGLLGFGLGGCALFTPATGTTSTTLATIATLSKAFVCNVSAGSALAQTIEQQVKASSGAQATTGAVAVSSATVCAAMGGALTGQTVTNTVGVAATPAVP